jgi:hypothetical protein
MADLVLAVQRLHRESTKGFELELLSNFSSPLLKGSGGLFLKHFRRGCPQLHLLSERPAGSCDDCCILVDIFSKTSPLMNMAHHAGLRDTRIVAYVFIRCMNLCVANII